MLTSAHAIPDVLALFFVVKRIRIVQNNAVSFVAGGAPLLALFPDCVNMAVKRVHRPGQQGYVSAQLWRRPSSRSRVRICFLLLSLVRNPVTRSHYAPTGRQKAPYAVYGT